MWFNQTVTVVFPAYNEEPNIRAAVLDFLSIKDLSGKRVVDEVLVVDNNSKDKTGEFARAAGARVVVETKQGYGNALQRGLKEANADLVVMCEPDGTFVARDILKLLTYSEDFDVVCGTRTTRELIWEAANMGWALRFGNVVVAKFMQVLYSTCSLSDCGCTFRLLRRSAVEAISQDLHVGRSHFLPNVVIAAKKNGQSMIEIPLTYRGRVGESKITGNLKGIVSTAVRMIQLMITSWPDYMLNKRKAASKNMNKAA